MICGMPENKRKILLLSAYEAKSHKHWRKFLEKNLEEIHITSLILPPRFFSWRVYGNPIIFNEYETEELSGKFDLIIATSMCDMATIKGFFPNLSDTPLIVYFHENQFAYPETERVKSYQDAQMKSINSAIVADKILFNSFYNLQTFLEKGDRLLKRMPDFNKIEVFDRLADKSEVLPVPVYPLASYVNNSNDIPVILWNHRWEYDKAPESFFKAMEKLKNKGYRFKLNVVGQQFRKQPECFDKYKVILEDEIMNWGYVEATEEYHDILRISDFIVSTSLHEFQGLSVLEAVSAGCCPIVPNRLSYKEIFPMEYRYESFGKFPEKEVDFLVEKLSECIENRQNSTGLIIPDVSAFYPENLIDRYRSVVNSFF